ncbi:MAG: ribosome recycling factor [Cytophagales bacterium]|nr:MAG: ribosome recycling factor [Rhodothermaeota bacterium MED-G19]
MEEIDLILEDTKERMDKSIQFLITELKKIRAGKATPSMLDGIMVEYYGVPTPLLQVASITTPDSRTLFIKPWEKTIIQDIEKSIVNSDLGLNPQNDGENVIINIPPLTEERRLVLVKQIKSEGEKGKISIRSVRKESNELVKKLSNEGVSEDAISNGENDIQKITDVKINKIDDIIKSKEVEITTI